MLNFFSRRRILAMAASTPIISMHSTPARAEPISAAVVCMWVAKAAVSYAAGKVFSSVLGDKGGVTNEEILNAIRDSAEDVKKHVSAEIRSAITEDNIRKLQASAESVNKKIRDFKMSSRKNGSLYLLHDADISARNGAELADNLGLPATAAFSIFVSQRIAIESELYPINHDLGLRMSFSDDIWNYADVLEEKARSYLNSFTVDERMTKLECWKKSDGGQLPYTYAWCEYKQDGIKKIAAEGFANNEDQISSVRAAASRAYQDNVKIINDLAVDVQDSFFNPMLLIAEAWRKESDGLSGRNLFK